MRVLLLHLAAVWGLLLWLGLRLWVGLRLLLLMHSDGWAACIAAILVATGSAALPGACI